MPQKQNPEHGRFVSISLIILRSASSVSRVARGVKLETGVGEVVIVETIVGLGVLDTKVVGIDVGVLLGCVVTISIEVARIAAGVGVSEEGLPQLVRRIQQPKIRG